MNWNDVIGPGSLAVLLGAGLTLAVPTALAAIGETISERAGVLNLGLEGMMLSGALAAFLGTYYTDSIILGVLCGAAAGIALGALMALLSVTMKTEQVINGIVLVLFAQGMTAYIFERLFGGSEQPTIDGIPDLKIPLLGDIPEIGTILFNHNALIYGSIVLLVLMWLVMTRTRWGLSLKAVGESPAAADAAAVRVDRVRWQALLVCGALAGLGGTVLVLGSLNLFQPNVTAGRGWIAIALVIFGRWNPPLVIGGALLFGVTDALQLRVRAVGGGTESAVPYELFQALPYLVTLLVLIIVTVLARRNPQPSALGLPFRKSGSR